MKINSIFTAALATAFTFLFSCSQDANLLQSDQISNLEGTYEAILATRSQDANSLSENTAYAVDNEETAWKGYSVAGPKVETSSTELADHVKEFLEQLQKELDATYSKTDVSTRSLGKQEVGILKYSTCGSYPEFHYHQDNEDGGWTSITGTMGATYVDGNKNMEWRFCVVPGTKMVLKPNENPPVQFALHTYGGGVLLLSSYQWSKPDSVVNLYYRYHDDEDTKNANKITRNDANLLKINGYIGESWFADNTEFCWAFDSNAQIKDASLGFQYGVIESSNGYYNSVISIDDEDKNNKNHSTRKEFNNQSTPIVTTNINLWGIIQGQKNTYYYVKYW